MKISIIIPTKNRAKKLLCVLKLLEKQNFQDFEVVVVNDGKEKNKLSNNIKLKIKYISSGEQGVSHSRNIGVKNSTGDIIIFMGDDTYPDNHFVEAHTQFHQKNTQENIAMVGLVEWFDMYGNTPLYRFLNSGIQQEYDSLTKSKQTDIYHFYTSNLSIKKSFLEEFNERITIPAYEDIELAHRLSKKNLILIYNPDAKVFHDHFYNDQLLKKRAFAAGYNFKILERLIPGMRSPYHCSATNRIKLFFLSYLKIINKYKIPYYHYLYKDNFLRGYCKQ